MRKIDDSGNADRRTRFSSWAEARSRPKGFSTMTRASVVSPTVARAAVRRLKARTGCRPGMHSEPPDRRGW